MKWLIALLLTLNLSAQAKPLSDHTWTTTDTVLESVIATELLIDWRQTSDYHRTHTLGYPASQWAHEETDPVLGRHPTQATLNQWFAGYVIGHVLIAKLLPVGPRRMWQGYTLGMELYVTNRNARLNCRLRW